MQPADKGKRNGIFCIHYRQFLYSDLQTITYIHKKMKMNWIDKIPNNILLKLYQNNENEFDR